jgi:hypothetical protein
METSSKILLVIAFAVIAVLVYIFFIGTPRNPGNVNIGTEVPAEVIDGKCVSREGIEIGLCCAVWDNALGDVKWVTCEDYAKPVNPIDTQAFFRFDNAPSILEQQSLIMYSMLITNSGNVAAEFRISSVATTSTSGNPVSEQEFTKAFQSFGTEWYNLPKGGFKDFEMSCPNVIRLDLPAYSASCGINAFKVIDGNYTTTITIEYRKPGTTTTLGSTVKSIKQDVTQEVISFNIDINPQ